MSSSDAGGPLLAMGTQLADAVDRTPTGEIPDELAQCLFRLAVTTYYRKRAAGADFGPFVDAREVPATAALVAAANLLQAADIDVFELGMWTRQGHL